MGTICVRFFHFGTPLFKQCSDHFSVLCDSFIERCNLKKKRRNLHQTWGKTLDHFESRVNNEFTDTDVDRVLHKIVISFMHCLNTGMQSL